MTVPVQESAPILTRDTEFLADLNDPTAGYVANARFYAPLTAFRAATKLTAASPVLPGTLLRRMGSLVLSEIYL